MHGHSAGWSMSCLIIRGKLWQEARIEKCQQRPSGTGGCLCEVVLKLVLMESCFLHLSTVVVLGQNGWPRAILKESRSGVWHTLWVWNCHTHFCSPWPWLAKVINCPIECSTFWICLMASSWSHLAYCCTILFPVNWKFNKKGNRFKLNTFARIPVMLYTSSCITLAYISHRPTIVILKLIAGLR